MRVLLALLLTACGPLPEDDMPPSIFRDRSSREVLQPQSPAQVANEVTTDDQLRAAIGAAVNPETGTSHGRVITLAAGVITLDDGPLVFGPAQSGLTIIGQSTQLFAPSTGPCVTIDDTGNVVDVVFENIRFVVELASGSNACITGGTLFGPSFEFVRCQFSGAQHSIRSTAQSEISLLMCRDDTGSGSFIQNNNARYIGNRQSPFAAIVISGGSGGDNVISGNAMVGADITTSASAGRNTITGNTNVGTLTPHGTDNTTGGNT